MTYLSDRNKKKKQLIQRTVAACLLLLVIFLWRFIQGGVSSGAGYIEEGLFIFSQHVHSFDQGIATFFTSKKTYTDTITSLQNENDALKRELALREETQMDTTASGTISMLSVKKETKDESHHVQVYSLFSPLSTIYTTFLISKGFSDGVVTGDIVTTGDYSIIGKVDLVHQDTSRVALLSASGNEVEGIIGSSTSIRLVGIGGGDFSSELPKGVPVNVGDTIFFKENRAMKLGVVVSIDNEPQSVSQFLHIRGGYSITEAIRLYIDLP